MQSTWFECHYVIADRHGWITGIRIPSSEVCEGGNNASDDEKGLWVGTLRTCT